ncbi:hypothetical protein C8A05DRAFT_33404 [Staphylotrichum tortipilum]|uniref:Protein kinase domain-containing protein n=1 Tax=Staphylotrichum tortipilum TaxID=2831512 RepID=A0AAN6ML17_9PEZI|nr:hypothetical protein C8A05DRAFT_33404 [Staphylotrichum longicolle]
MTGDGGRIVRQVEVIGGPGDDEIVSVFKPVTKPTLDAFIDQHSGRDGHTCRGQDGMSKDGATALRTLLLALKFMHGHQFVHGNLKPGNVGIDLQPIRVTLLEVGTASRLQQPGDMLVPTPVGPLIKKLLRFPRLDLVPEARPANTGVRITVDEALSDHWGPEFLNARDPGAKRQRRGLDDGVDEEGLR